MSRRILLADDSVTIQKVIELTFMDEDFDVKAVSNGDEAIAALPAANPDFVIADVHMPGANGYEVCRRSKQLRPQVPVLLLVGTFEPFDEAQARAAGADSFLKKPFDSQELLQRVQELLAARAAAPSGAAAAPAPSAPSAPSDIAAPPPLPAFAPAEALPPLDLDAAPAAAEPAWSSFDLTAEPEPFAAPPPAAVPAAPREENPFLAEESPFLLVEEEHAETAYRLDESPTLPADEPIFELEPEPGFAAPASPPAPEPLAAPEPVFKAPELTAPAAAPWTGEETAVEEPPPPSIPSVVAAHEPESSGRPAVESLPPSLPVGSVVPANGRLSDEDVDRIARRVVELLGDKAVRDVAWEVIPDLAEVVIRDRLRELESQAENPAE